MWFNANAEFGHTEVIYPVQNGVTAQNGEKPIRLPIGLLYPRVEVEQRTHSGDKIGLSSVGPSITIVHTRKL